MSLKILVLESRFYPNISDMLYEGARRVLHRVDADIDRIAVSGALDIPVALSLVIKRCAARAGEAAPPVRDARRAGHDAGRAFPYDGVLATGCVIRGETAHFDIVAQESARALMMLATENPIALGNAILTVENREQAQMRADPAIRDKGGESALALLALVDIERGEGSTLACVAAKKDNAP